MRLRLTILAAILSVAFQLQAQPPVVQYKGKMSKIRMEGNVGAAVLVDTILTPHLYAIGPVKDMRGEIMVWEGRPFVAGIIGEKNQPFVEKDVKPLEAVFLVYASVPKWDTILLQQKISSIKELESAIAKAAAKHGIDTATAFPFLLHGKVKTGNGHIMFKDTSEKLINPETLQKAKYVNSFANQKALMLGFYSQHHQTIFTHHDSFLHIHYRMYNKYQAGHLDEVAFDESESIILLLPHL